MPDRKSQVEIKNRLCKYFVVGGVGRVEYSRSMLAPIQETSWFGYRHSTTERENVKESQLCASVGFHKGVAAIGMLLCMRFLGIEGFW